MFPLREELLPDPVELRCGAVVQEYRGAAMDVAKLNRLCTHARVNFARFIKAKGLRPTHAGAFRWNLSFLPEGSCYRCLNDEEFRFRDRYYKGTLIGYSDLVYQYVFVFSDSHDADFALTFVHELFHAMSMFYGIYENHPGSWDEKNVIEERLAEDFTAWLGYGR